MAYEDTGSREFKELKERVEKALTDVFQGYPNFLYVVVIGFSEGSVIANYSVAFSDAVSPNESELSNRLKAANGTEVLDGLLVKNVIFSQLSVKQEEKEESSDSLPGWVVALIVLACLAFLVLIIVLAVLLMVSAFGVISLYGLYRYVWPQRVWFFNCFGPKQGIDFSHFGHK